MTPLHHRVQGQGPLLVLSHALGCDLHMWDSTVPHLSDRYTVVCYDHRGHGQSPGGRTPYTMDELADDAAGLISHLDLGPAHFVGLSMGGMVGQALAARAPGWVRSLVIANTTSHYDTAARAAWAQRIDTVRSHGLAAIADGAMQRWLSDAFRHNHPAETAALRNVLLQTDPVAYTHACAAVAGIQLQPSNPRLTCPTLVVAGLQDQATPVAMSEALVGQIPGAVLASIDAAHLSAVEQPSLFAALVGDFVDRAGGASRRTPPP